MHNTPRLFAHQEHTASWYATSSGPTPHYPTLQNSVQADVCVIGAGYTGLSAALELAKRGFSVVILEGARVGWGASGRNGGQVLNDVACGMETIAQQLGREQARRVWQMSLEAVELVKERVEAYHIDCHLQWGYVHAALKMRQMDALRQWQQQAADHYDYHDFNILEGRYELDPYLRSSRYIGGLYDPNSGHLHPLRYALGLAQAASHSGVQIYEHSPVQAIKAGPPAVLNTPQGQVQANYVVLAGNTYLGELAPALDRRIMPVGTYIIATEPLGESLARSLLPQNSAVCDTNFVLDYFRLSHDWRLLFGGRVSYSGMSPLNLKQSMRQDMLKVFPKLAASKVEFGWGGFVDITMNRTPDFGRLLPHVFYAQGFSGHGVALTGLAGLLMAEAISGQAGRFDVFSRLKHRPFPGGPRFRTPALVLAMLWYRLRDLL